MHTATQAASPRVSVVMNCYNSATYLRKAIDSVYAQTFSNWEIVFWDNASTDDSPAIARSYNSHLRYFRGERTVPLGHARNLAIAEARGEFIAFLDCDDLWLPEKLAKQVPLFDANPRVGAVYCDTIYFNANGDVRQLYRERKPPRGNVFRQLLAGYFLSLETVVIRRASLDGFAEWFDERFNMIEEGDLFRRIAHDWEFDYVDQVLSKWRIHSNSGSMTRHNELFPEETDMMLEKYRHLYPGFDRDYAEEVRILEGERNFIAGLREWADGNSGKLREYLRNHLFQNKKYLISYLLSFIMSYKVFHRLLKMSGRFEH